MDSCKNFSEKYPIILVVLTFSLMFVLLKLVGMLPEGPLELAIREVVMAVVIFMVTYLFMGKEKVSFSTKGFGYTFGFLRGYLTVMTVIAAFTAVCNILGQVVLGTGSPYQMLAFINMLIAGLGVGIVEEFSFRGLIFGGLLQKLGNTKKGIILAAVISGFLFGILHVLGSILAGEVTTVGAATTAILKIVQCAIFGIVLAFVYYKTRNLFAVAAVHSLDDFMLFVATNTGNDVGSNYVTSKDIAIAVIGYTIFTLILVPTLIRCIKDIKPEEKVFDENFLPRAVVFERKSKKK